MSCISTSGQIPLQKKGKKSYTILGIEKYIVIVFIGWSVPGLCVLLASHGMLSDWPRWDGDSCHPQRGPVST